MIADDELNRPLEITAEPAVLTVTKAK